MSSVKLLQNLSNKKLFKASVKPKLEAETDVIREQTVITCIQVKTERQQEVGC